jgi:hypothetical protein
MANKRKALAWSATGNEIDTFFAEICGLPYVCPCKVLDRRSDDSRLGEIELMNGGVNWIDFDGGGDVETRLLQSQAKPSGSRK